MEGFIWLFIALITPLAVFGVVAATVRRREIDVDQTRHCPHCETPMSMRRNSLLQSLTHRGMWMCPHFGTRINNVGKRVRTVA